MLRRSRPVTIQALAIWLMLATVLASSIPSAQARRNRSQRRRKALIQGRPHQPRASRLTSGLAKVGSPKVLVVRRKGVRTFARTSAAFRRAVPFPTEDLLLDPAAPMAEQIDDIRDAKPKIILALGPAAASVLAKGGAGAPVIFGYLASSPATAVSQGGWLVPAPSSRKVLGMLRRLVRRLRRVAVVVKDPKGRLAKEFTAACASLGVRPLVLLAPSAAHVLPQVVAALKRRPDAIWLGRRVALYPPAVLRQLVRIQALFRLPVVGVTREHARRGLLMALDATSKEVARAAQRLLARKVARWLLGTGHATGGKVSSLARQEVTPSRFSINPRTARALGLDPRAAVRLGAQEVLP